MVQAPIIHVMQLSKQMISIGRKTRHQLSFTSTHKKNAHTSHTTSPPSQLTMITFYDLAAKDTIKCWSPNPWKVR